MGLFIISGDSFKRIPKENAITANAGVAKWSKNSSAQLKCIHL